ncbi:hypothetical protein KIN20_005121 [Parelaphostrongylus tenuis]|uniref:Uncharacterized protein n=1 Tax=Parelaphostrongylus tenuis TaxID=148309 RepID=A0AAD5LZK9_PARTN|nr:hypothetical protein KIN20_005121 [Parelaphostrongylus tenuis]
MLADFDKKDSANAHIAKKVKKRFDDCERARTCRTHVSVRMRHHPIMVYVAQWSISCVDVNSIHFIKLKGTSKVFHSKHAPNDGSQNIIVVFN